MGELKKRILDGGLIYQNEDLNFEKELNAIAKSQLLKWIDEIKKDHPRISDLESFQSGNWNEAYKEYVKLEGFWYRKWFGDIK
jgi:hypothetical protein